MTTFRVRDAKLPEDKPAILDFIMGLQDFERRIEPDRRVDPAVGEEFYFVLLERIATQHGHVFIAEDRNGAAIGWAQVHEEMNQVYVVPEERRFAHIAELYVAESARGQGIGRALIAACEAWTRARGLRVITIGALAKNERAYDLYRDSGYHPYVTELRKYL